MEQLNLPIGGQIPANTSVYTWPCYWGGVVQSQNPPLIHSKVRDLRISVGGIEAKKVAGGPQFPVRGAKELAQKLAQALCDLNLLAPVVAQDVTIIETDKIPGNATASGKPVFRTLAHVKATVRLCAEDGSFVDMVGSGHGGDVDDKAGGKADTYAWKIALLKGLTLPEKDMIDTDDDSSETVEAKAPKPGPKPKEDKAAQEPETPGVLAHVMERIASATNEELEKIKDEIKSGALPLEGADKLKASTAFLARRKWLESEAQNAPS